MTIVSELNPPLQTGRMLLEPLVPEHAAFLFELLLDERIYRYIPVDPPSSLEVVRERFQKLAPRRSPRGGEMWLNWVMKEVASDGYVGTLEATVFADGTAKIAYVVFPQFWRMGFACEGVGEVLSYLWRSFPLERIVAEVETRNVASYRLLESLGFSRCGCTEDADFFKGSRSHEYRYEMLRSVL